MVASRFNVRVPIGHGDEFLMNMLSDSQLIVSADVAALLDRPSSVDESVALTGEARGAIQTLAEHGFLVADREAEWRALEARFASIREDRDELRVTLLTTLQCNLACEYCYQGDADDHGRLAEKMSMETAGRVAAWIEARLDAIHPRRLTLTFFGGEPLLNQPVMFSLAERLWHATQARGQEQVVTIVTNGLLLTPDIVDRLEPFGLYGVKVTLDGDRETHDRARPLRGGQGTFDRIIANLRSVAGRCAIGIGGNFDVATADRYPALLDFLKEQDFAPSLAKVTFKPVITPRRDAGGRPVSTGRAIPLTAVGTDGRPLGGACMTSAGSGASVCSSCDFVDEKMAFLREETRKRGFPTLDGVHMGPCEIHKRHAYTIGPDGSLYACPGFSGEPAQSVGHIEGRPEDWRRQAAERFEKLAAWKACSECPFVPVCAGGCATASHVELGDMNQPSCHKVSFEAGVAAMAADAAAMP